MRSSSNDGYGQLGGVSSPELPHSRETSDPQGTFGRAASVPSANMGGGKRLSPGRSTRSVWLAIASVFASAPGVAAQVPEFQQQRAIGALEDADAPAFGLIIRAVIGDSLLWVLDRSAIRGHLTAISVPEGDVIARSGARGGGPAEFRFPVALSRLPDGKMIVFDTGNLRASFFQLVDGALQLDHDVRLPFPITDACVLGHRVFVLGFHGNALVHELDLTGDDIRSFGRPFLPDVPSVDLGRILCLDTGDLIVASTHAAVIRRYSSNGELLWQHTVAAFAPHQISLNSAGGRTFSGPASGGEPDMVATVTSVRGHQVWVQFGEIWPELRSTEELTDVTTVILDFETGEPVATHDDIPRMDVIANTRAIAHPALPYPRVFLYRVAEKGG